MPTVVPVSFRYAARDLWFDPAGTGAGEGDRVICHTARGTEAGLVTADAREVGEEELAARTGGAELKPVARVADEDDIARIAELEELGDEALPVFRRLVKESGLDMKPVGVEYLFDGDRAVCYFSAEERVDFRHLVRELSRELHRRVDMRQIGVREEAAVVGGYAHCGQELCCARFGSGFEPVSIRMAKEQDLPLNSTKISGVCGRLMCCLRYEFEAYRNFKGRAPKRNATILTPLGKARVVEYDTPKEELALRLEGGKVLRVPLAGMEASEAARRKSEELGCPCRPDTVTREALDRLESPEVKMALAELDRANGVVPEDGIPDEDILVKPRRRRRRPSSGEPRPAQEGSGDSSSRPSRRRRRRKPAASQEASGEQRRGRQDGDGPAAAQEGERPKSSRRRRRRSKSRRSGGEGQEQRREERPQGQGGETKQRTRRRHPGDGGGSQQGRPPAQGRRPRRHHKGEGSGDGEQ